MDRQAMIDETIAACEHCGSHEFPKRSDCDGCTAAVDDEIAAKAADSKRRLKTCLE